MKTLISFIFVLYFSTVILAENRNKTRVSVYYESLCSDSQNFFYYQLLPTYEILKKYMTVDLVPFGKAMFYKGKDGKIRFSCQHGNFECIGNAVHACILSSDLTEEYKLKFVNCLMVLQDPGKCSSKFGVDYRKLKNCLKKEASEFLMNYGKRTLREVGQVTYVPTIFLDGYYSKTLQDMAETNLFKAICKLQKYPKECIVTSKHPKNKKHKGHRKE